MEEPCRVDEREPPNVTRFWTPPEARGLNLMQAAFTTHEFPLHTHDAFVLAMTEAGGSQIRSRGEIQHADGAGLFVFNPGEPQAGWMGRSTQWRYRSFYMAKPAMDVLARDLGLAELPYFTRNRFADPGLIAEFIDLHRCFDEPGDATLRRQRLIEGFARLFGRYGHGARPARPPGRDDRRLRLATEIMRARFGEALTLDDLAGPVGISCFQLIGLFKRATGLTPHAYLTQIRLGEACRRLKRGMPIAEVASDCGFYDQSALNKHFKRCYALTPRQFALAFTYRNYSQYRPVRGA